MRTWCTALLATFALGFSGCASAPSTTVATADPETKIDLSNSIWAPFSGYFTQLTGSINQQWYRILENSRASPPRGSQVVVHFKLNSSGDTEIVDIEDNGCGKLGVRAAIAAMDVSSPHPKWTDAMIAQLGTEQTLTFAFIYR